MMTSWNKDFVIFILSHGRADNVVTYKTLMGLNYTGRIVVVIDNEDGQAEQYQKRFKKDLYTFDKQKAIDATDAGDNFDTRKQIIFARNECFNIAKELGYTYFLQFDDDYTGFGYAFDNKKNYIASKPIRSFERIVQDTLKFYIASGVTSVAFAQGGDFIGGAASAVGTRYLRDEYVRKAMNSFFCSTERPFKFIGGINEDVNTYTCEQNRGLVFLTLAKIRLQQKQTQKNSGGMTGAYLDLGTYIKSFHTVMLCPSFVKVRKMGVNGGRLHHSIDWKSAVPLIISEDFKKRAKKSKDAPAP